MHFWCCNPIRICLFLLNFPHWMLPFLRAFRGWHHVPHEFSEQSERSFGSFSFPVFINTWSLQFAYRKCFSHLGTKPEKTGFGRWTVWGLILQDCRWTTQFCLMQSFCSFNWPVPLLQRVKPPVCE